MPAVRVKTYTIGVDAGNDRNGNPRRGWYVYDKEGSYLGFVDANYEGRGALRRLTTNNTELAEGLGISVTNYNEAVRRDNLDY